MNEEITVTPFNHCPLFTQEPYRCMGVQCQLWSISMPFSALEKTYPEGMCSIKLLAEAQAFLSRTSELGGLEGR